MKIVNLLLTLRTHWQLINVLKLLATDISNSLKRIKLINKT